MTKTTTKVLVRTQYEGTPISFADDGWFCATTAAKRFNKKPAKWLELPSTQSYMMALAKRIGALEVRKSDIKLVHTSKVRGQAGTWLHPKLAVAFARWLSDDFAVWCDLQIDRILRGESHVSNDDDQPSTVADRRPALHGVVDMVVTFRMSFPRAYRAVSAAVGADRFAAMTKGQVRIGVDFTHRVLAHTLTQADLRHLEVQSIGLLSQAQQLPLFTAEVLVALGRHKQ